MSLRITIGMFVTGSIIRPRIFISSSTGASLISLHHTRHGFTRQRIRPGARHANGNVTPEQRLARRRRMSKVERTILRRAADPLALRLVAPLHMRLLDLADQRRVTPDLDGALLLVEDHDAARLFFLRDVILHP